jgi:hypothetical protein
MARSDGEGSGSGRVESAEVNRLELSILLPACEINEDGALLSL